MIKGALRLAVIVAFAGAPPLAGAEIIDRILAIVDTQIITLSDARAALRFGLVPADVSTDPIGAALQRLIDRRLMLAEVDRYAPPDPPEPAVDARLAAVERPFPDALAFEIALNQSALTREDLRRHLRDGLRIEAYLQQRFSSAVQVSDDDLARYHREHAADFTRDGQLRPLDEVREIVRTRSVEAQRAALVRQWVEGLRRRGAVQLLYLPAATGK